MEFRTVFWGLDVEWSVGYHVFGSGVPALENLKELAQLFARVDVAMALDQHGAGQPRLGRGSLWEDVHGW